MPPERLPWLRRETPTLTGDITIKASQYRVPHSPSLGLAQALLLYTLKPKDAELIEQQLRSNLQAMENQRAEIERQYDKQQ